MIDHHSPDFSKPPCSRSFLNKFSRNRRHSNHIDISIITPYYNTESFFNETFLSIHSQSLQNWEWVIVNDGSTDQESVNRLSEIAAKDERIKVFHQKNSGPGAARNTAFKHTSGRYICLLDSDDMIEPTYLEKCAWFLDSYPDYAFCNAYSVVFGEQEYLWTTGFERGKDFLHANSGPPISVLRRSAYKDSGGFDESIRFGHEDWDFWLAMAKAGHWGFTIPEYLQWYRKRSNGRFEQIMQSGDINDDFEMMMHRKYNDLKNNFPSPSHRYMQPYETLETSSLIDNPIAINPSGRRIMIIVPWMVTGGADRVNLDLVEGMTLKGHDVTICATLKADHQWEHQFSCFTPDIFILPHFLHPTDYPRFLAYLIRSRTIDTVLVTGSTIGYQLLPFLRASAPEVIFIDMCHVEEPHWLNGGHPRFGVGYQDILDLNIVTTQHLAKWMENRGADSNRIKVMYTGVRSVPAKRLTDDRKEIRKALNIPPDIPVIIFAGRLCDQKRPMMLAEILKSIHDLDLTFKALIIGDGELKEQLANFLIQNNLTTVVQMLGSVPHQKWLDTLVASDIFLMPSKYEGISVALLESLAAGVVPVVSMVGGQEEIVNPGTGVLIPQQTKEIQDYVATIHHLLSNPDQLKQMSEKCRDLTTSKLSWDVMIETFLKILDEAHTLKNTSPRYPVGYGLGCELANLSLEYMRFSETFNWLAAERQHSISEIQHLKQMLSEKDINLSQILYSKRWKLINYLSAPYRKLKQQLFSHH